MIWLVTDHHDTRDVLIPLIRDLRYGVVAIDCGDALFKRLPFQQPRLIIVDCGLADAFELTSRLRADRHARSIPVIMFSSAGKNLKDQALLKGADAYVEKGPLDWSDLLSEITRFAGPPPSNPPDDNRPSPSR